MTIPLTRAPGPRDLLEDLAPALAEVLAPREAARPLPRAAFVDPASLALDAAALFAQRWVAVGHTGDLAEPGRWARVGWPGRRDLVTARNADLDLVLLSAICRHRGVPLVEGEGGHLPGLELACRYHGWTYDLGGALRRAPGLEPCHARSELGLRVGSTSSAGPVVFGALGEPPSESPALPPWLERANLGALQRVHVAAHLVRANWKLLVGNFQESHHFPRVHPGLEALTPFASSTSVTPAHGAWLGGTMELSAGNETVSPSGQREGRPFLAAPGDRARVHDAWLAPNLLTSLQPDYLLTYRLEPEAVDRTRVVFAIDVHAGVPEEVIVDGVENLVRFWSTTNAEDRAVCEAQQRGLEAAGPGYRAGPYARSEDGLHAFEAVVARAYLALLAPGSADLRAP